MSEEAILKEFSNIQSKNKDFANRVSFDKFMDIIQALEIIDSEYLSKEYQNCENITFRNIKIIDNCAAIAIRSNNNKINKIYEVLKKHNELNLFIDGFSLFYADADNVDKMLTYLTKQNYYMFLGKKTTLLTHGNYEDMIRISEFFKEIFNEDEQKHFFSRASIVLAQKFDNVKEIYNLLKSLNIPNEKIIFCSSIFTRNDVDKIKSSLKIMSTLKQHFNNESEYKVFIEQNLGILATAKTNDLPEIVTVVSNYLNKYPNTFSNITLGEFFTDCSSILARGKTETVVNAFKTFEEYDKLSIINSGKRSLVEERRKLCSLIDLFIEEGLERELNNHTTALQKNYENVFARISYLKNEKIFNPNDDNIVKIVMSKDFHWNESEYQKLDLYINNLYNPRENAERKFPLLNNEEYEESIHLEEKNNYPLYSLNADITSIIQELDDRYQKSNTVYIIANQIVSRQKVIRNLSIISKQDNLDINKALITSILYNKIADETIIKKVSEEIMNLNLVKTNSNFKK